MNALRQFPSPAPRPAPVVQSVNTYFRFLLSLSPPLWSVRFVILRHGKSILFHRPEGGFPRSQVSRELACAVGWTKVRSLFRGFLRGRSILSPLQSAGLAGR